MRKYILLTICLLFVLAFPLVASSYPSLDIDYELENEDEILLEQESIKNFIHQWQDDSLLTFSEVEKKLRKSLLSGNLDLEQLESLYRIQQQQIQYQKREQDFKIGFSSQPFYSLSRNLNQSPTGGFDLSNTFSAGATISKKFKTGAEALLSVSQQSSLAKNSNSGSLWKWTHRPSASLTINQPLWIGDGLIDFNYSNNELEKLKIAADNAKFSYNQLIEALVSQGNNQISILLSLKERRFLLGEQLLIEQSQIKDAKKDLEEGLISRNVYDQRVLNINQIRYSLSEIESQIDNIQDYLEKLWGSDDYPKQVILDNQLLENIPPIIFDKQQLIKIVLENDYKYAQAIGNLRSAEIDAMLKNPSDAPIVSLSFQISPFYTPSSGANFFTSFGDLITSSNPIFSLSIGFRASDFSRSTSNLSSSLATESVLQAKLEVEKAREEVEEYIVEIQRNINSLLHNLAIAQYDFEQRTNDIEVERIRFKIGLANESSIKIKEIAWYNSAFIVLQTLRELDLIALDLKSHGIEL